MALMANGSRLTQECYEFGVRRVRFDGTAETLLCDSLEDAEALTGSSRFNHARADTVFRAVYVTGWMETL